VGEAITQVRPFAVDVSSGIEEAPGKKDPGRMAAFINRVYEADWRCRHNA
jgi:phosphoribosylanthranilate isomerase